MLLYIPPIGGRSLYSLIPYLNDDGISIMISYNKSIIDSNVLIFHLDSSFLQFRFTCFLSV